MSRVDRAKLFIPFDALKDLQEILREKDLTPKKLLEKSEEKRFCGRLKRWRSFWS